jgi:DMSO/TMAO reductase YedYZ heme-binding membrane subunit
LTAFLKEVTLYFKKPFLRIHHYFAAAGLTLITLHPIALAIARLNPAVFIPTVGSLEAFIINGGRQALIILYIAFVAVLLRRKIPKYWRPIHALMYLALFFGILHADLIGTDFENLYILTTFNTLFAATIAAFIIKRYQNYQLKQKIKAKKQQANNATPR